MQGIAPSASPKISISVALQARERRAEKKGRGREDSPGGRGSQERGGKKA